MATRVRSVGHIAVVTRDFGRLAAFYADAFGAEVPERSDRDRHGGLGFVRLGDVTLHVFERPDGPLGGVTPELGARTFGRGRIDHFSLEAVDLPAFVAVRDRLVALGASDGAVTDFGPLVSLFFADPDGFLLEVSLTKTPDWDPPFAVVPFGRRAEG